jgi:preprotein translocase subunit SecD
MTRGVACSRTRVVGAFGLVLLIGLGSGCGDGDGTSSGREAPSSAIAATSSADTSEPAGDEAGAVQFRVVARSDIDAGPTGDGAPEEVRQAFDALVCPEVVPPPAAEDFAAACGPDGVKYLLEPAVISGGVEEAEASIPENQVNFVVTIQLDPAATKVFTRVSNELVGTGRQFAILLGGEVLSAPTVDAVITDGTLQISGSFSEDEARELADRMAASS